MNAIILLSLVTIVHGARRTCEENCRILPQELLRITPAHFCKCLEKYIVWLKANKLKENLREKRPDATYYLPATQNRQLLYPFHFSGSRKASPYNYNTEVPSIRIPNQTYKASNNVPSPISKIKRKNVDRDISFGANYAPLYLDINIFHGSNDNEAKSHGNILYQNKIKDLSEESLKDCLDLYIIKYSMTRGNNSIRGDDMLSERNKIYNKLPISDLDVEINKKCQKIESIFNESVNEIRMKRPFSKYNITHRNDEYSFDSFKTIKENSFGDEIIISETHPKLEMNTIEKTTPSMQSSPPIARENILDVENITETTYDNYDEQTLSNNSPAVTYPTISLFTETPVLPDISFDMYITTPDYKQEIRKSLDGDASTSDSIPELSNILVTTLIPHTNNISENIDNMSQINSYEHTTSDVGITNNYNETAIEMHKKGREESNIMVAEGLLNEEIMNYSTKLDRDGHNSAVNRTRYFEGEYAIPKVVTNELSNDTIISNVEGNEMIPNADFVIPLLETTDSSSINGIPHQWDDNQENSTRSSMQINDDTINISGKLYFKFGPTYIPASFVQKADGQVNVALDILSLCKSNKNEESTLIQAICNCIKFR